ncbi:MAG: molybdate ABC transporter substrate-binding protein [Thermoguttaceae bacterium]|jgi:molybdate transport system substrate-binding protein|nr:molybdate ABC transporter substrate-binding protein [Thermoguttaceae bacterium]
MRNYVEGNKLRAAGVTGLLITTWLAGCSNAPQNASEDTDRPNAAVVEVFAAASTTNAMDDIVDAFEAANSVQVKTNYAGSSMLAQQIAHGAEAGVYLSANETWADFLEEKGLVATRVDLLANSIVVVVPRGSSLELHRPEDLVSEEIEHLAMGDPAHVPAGMYAKEALENLGLWKQLEKKVLAGANVRQALTYVERGEVAAGIVYATDAAITDQVRVALAIDPSMTRPIRYPLVLTPVGADNAVAQSFFEFIQGPEAAAIWKRYGFTVLGSSNGQKARNSP